MNKRETREQIRAAKRAARKKMSLDFNYMGNLLFYQGTDVQASQRFFFFNLLLSDYAKNEYQGYRTKANQIGENAKAALKNSPFGKPDEKNSKTMQILEQAIKILRQGITYERENELRYVQKKLKDYKKLFDIGMKDIDELNVIETCLQSIEESINGDPVGFDYNSLINVINLLLQGLPNTKSIYNYEEKHLEEIATRYEIARDTFLAEVEGTAKRDQLDKAETLERLEKSNKKFQRQASKIYIKNQTFNLSETKGRVSTNLKKAMTEIFSGENYNETIDTKLARKINRYLNSIFSNPTTLKKITEILNKENPIINGYSNSETEVKKLITNFISEYITRNMSEMLNESMDYSTITEELLTEINEKSSQSFEIQIEGIYKNFRENGRKLNFFEKDLAAVLAGDTSAKGMYDVLVKLNEELNRSEEFEILDRQLLTESLKLENGKGRNKYKKLLQLVKKLESFSKELSDLTSRREKKFTFATGEKNDKDKFVKTGKATLLLTINNGEATLEGVDQLKNSEAILQDLGLKNFNPKNLEMAIKKIKEQISLSLKNDIIKLLEEQTRDTRRLVIYYKLKAYLQRITVSIDGPTYSSVVQQIQEKITPEGLKNGKFRLNDNITIIIEDGDFTDFKASIPMSQLKKPEQSIYKEILGRVNEYYQKYSKDYQDKIVKEIGKITKQRKYIDYDKVAEGFFKAEEERQKKYNSMKKAFDSATKKLTDKFKNDSKRRERVLQMIEKGKTFLNDLKNSLYVSTISQSFDHYQNDIGFVSKPVGGNIINQINSLNILFERAGMGLTQEEIDWLIFACINNSSLSVVGHENETLLESILGSLAVFALFDEGAAELQILRNKIEDGVQKMSSPDILHLYRLNGIYFPGSYILQTVLKNIEFVFYQMQMTIKDTVGAQSNIKIISEVSIKNLPNQHNSLVTKSTVLNQKPWETVSEIAISKTSINIIFLAGLLSVVMGLKKQLGETELFN